MGSVGSSQVELFWEMVSARTKIAPIKVAATKTSMSVVGKKNDTEEESNAFELGFIAWFAFKNGHYCPDRIFSSILAQGFQERRQMSGKEPLVLRYSSSQRSVAGLQ